MIKLKLKSNDKEIEEVLSEIRFPVKKELNSITQMNNFLSDLENEIDAGKKELEPAYDQCLKAVTTAKFLENHFKASLEVS